MRNCLPQYHATAPATPTYAPVKLRNLGEKHSANANATNAMAPAVTPAVSRYHSGDSRLATSRRRAACVRTLLRCAANGNLTSSARSRSVTPKKSSSLMNPTARKASAKAPRWRSSRKRSTASGPLPMPLTLPATKDASDCRGRSARLTTAELPSSAAAASAGAACIAVAKNAPPSAPVTLGYLARNRPHPDVERSPFPPPPPSDSNEPVTTSKCNLVPPPPNAESSKGRRRPP
mmetsp:Transcript_27279/g.68302  ORF Transcript_27279/g.68302 Transcript_27279/m.68302 type:complete len:234 (-) Transcript_27279:239-940(-)